MLTERSRPSPKFRFPAAERRFGGLLWPTFWLHRGRGVLFRTEKLPGIDSEWGM
jgi:hypothetical protein